MSRFLPGEEPLDGSGPRRARRLADGPANDAGGVDPSRPLPPARSERLSDTAVPAPDPWRPSAVETQVPLAEPEPAGRLGLSDLAAQAAVVHPRRRSRVGAVVVIVVALALLVGGGYLAIGRGGSFFQGLLGAKDYPGPGDQPVAVIVASGATATQIAQLLEEQDVVASAKAFVRAAKADPTTANKIQPGSYAMKTKMSAAAALQLLANPSNVLRNQFTVPEGLRNSEVVTRITAALPQVSAAALETALATTTAAGMPSWAKNNTEGFLFPQTYEYEDNPTAEVLVDKMTSEFAKEIAAIGFEQKAIALGRDPYDALIVASIIEKETRDPKYGPDVAQAIYNRLGRGMRLQVDATVHYANNSSGKITTTDQQRANPSPYNTYVHEGLPPGPISNPGRNSLQAAVNPSSGDFLYWVTTNPQTGETKFASSMDGHNANVAEFQRWCQAHPGQC